jgi:integrase
MQQDTQIYPVLSGKRSFSKRQRSPKGTIVVRELVQKSRGRTYRYWTISGLKKEGKRWIPKYTNGSEARRDAEHYKKERRNFGVTATELPIGVRAETAACLEKLRPFGKTITDAVNFYVTHLQTESKLEVSRTLEACLQDFVAEKVRLAERGDLRAISIQTTKSRAKRLAESLGSIPIQGIGSKHLSEFLANLPFSQVTKIHYRAFLSEFMSYALEREWIERNPLSSWGKTKRRKNLIREVQILSVAEVRKLLDVARNDEKAHIFIPYLALGLFLGLRPTEARLLNWSDIDLDHGSIEIKGSTSKVKSTRHIQINSTALAWLRAFKQSDAKIIVPLNDYEYRVSWDRIKNLAGWKVWEPNKAIEGDQIALKDWPEDCLRHCYASYWLPIHNDRPRLAEHMGTSTNVIQIYYRKSLAANTASAYWDILP